MIPVLRKSDYMGEETESLRIIAEWLICQDRESVLDSRSD